MKRQISNLWKHWCVDKHTQPVYRGLDAYDAAASSTHPDLLYIALHTL